MAFPVRDRMAGLYWYCLYICVPPEAELGLMTSLACLDVRPVIAVAVERTCHLCLTSVRLAQAHFQWDGHKVPKSSKWTPIQQTLQASVCVTFVKVALAKANHVAKARLKRWSNKLYLLMEGGTMLRCTEMCIEEWRGVAILATYHTSLQRCTLIYQQKL